MSVRLLKRHDQKTIMIRDNVLLSSLSACIKRPLVVVHQSCFIFKYPLKFYFAIFVDAFLVSSHNKIKPRHHVMAGNDREHHESSH